MSKRESMKANNDDGSIKDEQVRKDVQVLSARLYDLKERFRKIIHEINNDTIVDEDKTTDEESSEEMSINKENNSSKTSSSDSDDDRHLTKSKTPTSLIKSILQRKARHHEYIKHILQYPKIVRYLINENPDCKSIPIRYLEPFIKEYVNKNPNGKIYDRVSHQIQDIRRIYLKACQ